MHNFESVVSAFPSAPQSQAEHKLLKDCTDACVDCEFACVSCASACLAEQQLDLLRRCIRLELDCGDICGATARLLARVVTGDARVLKSQLEVCAQACGECAAECERHAHHAHCAACAKACRACEQACEQLAQTLPGVA